MTSSKQYRYHITKNEMMMREHVLSPLSRDLIDRGQRIRLSGHAPAARMAYMVKMSAWRKLNLGVP